MRDGDANRAPPQFLFIWFIFLKFVGAKQGSDYDGYLLPLLLVLHFLRQQSPLLGSCCFSCISFFIFSNLLQLKKWTR